MGLTIDQILKSSDEELLKLLGRELESKLSTKRGTTEHVAEIKMLPVGLRSMAATYELDVSLSLDDLGWHFGNWHNKEMARETLQGLIELGASELAGLFGRSFEIAQDYWTEMGAKNWADCYHDSKFERATEPLTDRAWEILKDKELGIFKYWVDYARRCPDGVGVGD